MKKYTVRLEAAERSRLERLVRVGKGAAYRIRHANILLAVDESPAGPKMTDVEAAPYVLVHRGGRGQQFVYELLYDGGGRDGRPFVAGLVDVAALRCKYGADFEGSKPHFEVPGSEFEGGSSPQRAPIAGGFEIRENCGNSCGCSQLPHPCAADPQDAHLDDSSEWAPRGGRRGSYLHFSGRGCAPWGHSGFRHG